MAIGMTNIFEKAVEDSLNTEISKQGRSVIHKEAEAIKMSQEVVKHTLIISQRDSISSLKHRFFE